MSALPTAKKCIFCRIVSGEIPGSRVYEDTHLLAFLDVNPVSRGHTLLIPKGHYETALAVPEYIGREIMPVVARIGKAVMGAMNADGFNCLQNNFPAAGQIVFHSHWHIIPRVVGDGLTQWPHKSSMDLAAMKEISEAIQMHLK
ncbi:hydrolase [Deltaproteobacteria bacterium]|nr:hydrolase [Deltaproteobacteria bacterium]